MTNPTLTLDEELDVLEAVYKIGKEKGLELLRPEQVKKLRDGGKLIHSERKEVKHQNFLGSHGAKVGKIIPLNDKQKKAVRNFYIAKEVTTQLRESLQKDFPEFFNFDLPKDRDDLKLLYDDVFRAAYGTSPQFFANDLFNKLNGLRG